MLRRYVFLLALVSMMFCQNRAYAQAAALTQGYSGTVNRVVANAVASNLARRGITVAANDATMLATESFIGAAANAASYAAPAVAGVAAVAGVPVWLTVALGVGALAAVGGVAWGAYQLLQNNASSGTTPDGQPLPVSLTLQTQAPQSSSSGGSSSGSSVRYDLPSCPSNCQQGVPLLPNTIPYYATWSLDYPTPQNSVLGGYSGLDLANQEAAALARYWCATYSGTYVNCVGSVAFAGTSASVEPLPYTVTVTYNYAFQYGSGVNATSHTYSVSSSASKNPAYVNTALTGSLTTIEPDITPAMVSSPAPQQLLADMANQLWQDAAARPGYNGQPYSATNPISVQDIAASPDVATWADMLSTPAPIGSTVVPISPTASSTTSTGTGTGTSTSTSSTPSSDDLCTSNPNSLACVELGSPASAPALPTSSVQVPMAPWSIGSNTGTCPAGSSIQIFSQTYTFSFAPLCQFALSIQPVVLMLCALAAALIVIAGI